MPRRKPAKQSSSASPHRAKYPGVRLKLGKPLPAMVHRRPLCPDHQSRMRYLPDQLRWRCLDESCPRYAKPAPVELAGSPFQEQVIKTPVSIRVLMPFVSTTTAGETGENRYYLSLPELNVLIDITGQMGLRTRDPVLEYSIDGVPLLSTDIPLVLHWLEA